MNTRLVKRCELQVFNLDRILSCGAGESRRPQDTGENVIVTLKISKEKVIYGVLDGVNNPTNSCGIWSFQNNTEVLQWRRHAEVGAAETDS